MVFVAMNSPEIPVGLLDISNEEDFEVTSIAIAAVIMILYNLYTWVELTQSLQNGEQFSDKETELERAKQLISHMDDVCRLCSTINN